VGVNLRQFDGDLGTIGGGNHFAELQSVEEVQGRHFICCCLGKVVV